MQIAVLEQKRAMAQEQEKMREEYQNFQRQKQEMELELQRQQQEAMDRQMAQMKLMFEEQFKKQQDEIENLRKVYDHMKFKVSKIKGFSRIFFPLHKKNHPFFFIGNSMAHICLYQA